MNEGLLGLGLIIGLVFAGVMIFAVLPNVDHMVKRDYGIVEAIFLTRICALLVALPLAIFTIWMTLVILFDGSKGISVIQDVCPEKYGCTNVFAMGRTNHNKEACDVSTCGIENLLARSGSQPIQFARLGLGQNLDPLFEEITYQCTARSEEDACIEFTSASETCRCVEDGVEQIDSHQFCASLEDCMDDINVNTRTETCVEVDGTNQCTKFNVEIDSAKQFTLQECECVSDTCDEFKCSSVTMEYFYPNTLYAVLAVTIFVFPALAAAYYLLKIQGRRIFKCKHPNVILYDQSAGIQEAPTAEDVRTGGFYVNQADSNQKFRKLSVWDVPRFLGALAVAVFFSVLSVIVAGRVGMAFVTLPAVGILIYELYQWKEMCRKQKEGLKKTMKRVNGHPAGPTL